MTWGTSLSKLAVTLRFVQCIHYSASKPAPFPTPATTFPFLPLKTHRTESSVSKVWPLGDLDLHMQIPGLLTRPTESQIQTSKA